ncbi:MAG TPA: cell division protein ZapA [Candidatus Cloacimonadota bacterium]|nr:cell division protein ZapA [Candidatus Cloacimonadota bacterium]HPS38912.1 cell division protein ZapA [Candidatus Cloacimonadota bacterium]
MNSIEVEIYGRIFRLRSQDPALTMQIAADINKQINELKEKYDNLDFTKLLLLVSLQQQEQVQLLQIRNKELSTDLDRMNQMISKIIGEVEEI